MNNSPNDELARLVLERTGIRIRVADETKFLDAVAKRLHALGCTDEQEYARLLRADSVAARHEWKALVAHITVGESYFFRDRGQMALLENWILPELVERQRPQRSLRLWSAGCSTGEEPYTLAMLVQLALPQSAGWAVDILGTDINQEALDKAVAGEYGAWSFRRVDPALKRRFFQRRGQRWRVNPDVRKQVTFRCQNLKTDTFPSAKEGRHDLDLIVCRNVLIYLDRASTAVVVNKLTHSLKPGGYLLTGHTELYAHPTPGLRARTFPGSLIYERVEEAKRVPPALDACPTPRRAAFPPATVVTSAPSAVEHADASRPLDRAREAFQRGRFDLAIRQATLCLREHPQHVDALVLAARSNANAGHYAQANVLCQRALKASPFAFEVYFLMAQLAEA